MNKKFTELFTNYNMKIEGNDAYGMINGFETNVTIRTFDNVSPVNLHFSCYLTDEEKRNTESALRKAKIKFFRFQFTQYGLLIGLNDITVGSLIKRLPAIMDQISGYLKENNAKGVEYCPICGEVLDNLTAKKCNIDHFIINLDQGCVENLNAVLVEENKEFEQAPNNYFKGLLGAIIGGFVGAIVAILFYIAGYISSLSAFVAIILGSYLYKKMNGKQNKMMILIVTLSTVFFMIVAIFSIYIYVAAVAAAEVNLDMPAFAVFKLCMEDAEFSRTFYSDLGLTLFFTFLGVIYQVISLTKGIKRNTQINVK